MLKNNESKLMNNGQVLKVNKKQLKFVEFSKLNYKKIEFQASEL